MLAHTQPAPRYADSELDDFRVADPAGVQVLLRELVDAGTLLHLNGPDGNSYITTLWTVDAARGRICFSADADHPQLQRLLNAGEAVVVGYLDSVKLQFELDGLVLVHGQTSCALQAELPAELFRFQRRSTFRVRTLARTSPSVKLRHPSIPDMQIALRVLDVSMGGCALLLPAVVPALPALVRIRQVTIELDADTSFTATLQLQHVTSIHAADHGVRLGCELHELTGDAQRTLQRYIDHTQKRRRLMALD